MKKLCRKCGIRPRAISKSKIQSYCKECHNEYMKAYFKTAIGKKQLANNNLRKYGITIDDYRNMLYEQNDACAICKIPNEDLKRKLAVDHCHDTKEIRGLLCFHCNSALGKLKHDVRLLKGAIEYLTK